MSSPWRRVFVNIERQTTVSTSNEVEPGGLVATHTDTLCNGGPPAGLPGDDDWGNPRQGVSRRGAPTRVCADKGKGNTKTHSHTKEQLKDGV